jgi:hypothetical protein
MAYFMMTTPWDDARCGMTCWGTWHNMLGNSNFRKRLTPCSGAVCGKSYLWWRWRVLDLLGWGRRVSHNLQGQPPAQCHS